MSVLSLKDNIKKYRMLADLTLEDLATKVGVSRQTIQRYESGVINNIPSDNIEKIALALDTTPANLMGWEEKSKLININEDVSDYGQKNKELLDLYHQLNGDGKNKLIEYAQDLINGGRYKKVVSGQKISNS